MEIPLITAGLCIALLLPVELRSSGLVWASIAVSIFAMTFPEQVERSYKKRLKVPEGRYKRCDCCDNLVRETDTLCNHCKLEVSLGSQR